jgi:hypothetical protein
LDEIRQSPRRLHPFLQIAVFKKLHLHLHIIPSLLERCLGPLCELAKINLELMQVVQQVRHFRIREELGKFGENIRGVIVMKVELLRL